MLTKEIATLEGFVPRAQSIRITVPAKAAYDLKAFQRVLASLAERLGCRPCLSGADCFFQFERDFVVNPETFELGGVQQQHLG